ncbi:MAG: FHA domain-containing protein [Pseudomonadota bacterium]
MNGIRGLIARRRPSQSGPDADAGMERPTTLSLEPVEGPHAAPAAPSHPVGPDSGLAMAQAARDQVPSPPRPKADQYPDWSKPSERPQTSTHLADKPAGPLEARPKQKIWDLQPGSGAPRSKPAAAALPDTPAPAQSAPRLARQPSQRAKTRLLGFHQGDEQADAFAGQPKGPAAANPCFPVGWIVVADGPGRGASFTLTAGLSTIGRDPDQTVSLDFGDTSISRSGHVSIAYDVSDNTVFVAHGGKQNIVRHNDKPLLMTEELHNGDTLTIGQTVLRFVGLCGSDFSWGPAQIGGMPHD